jgi:hypothetical protein
MAAEGVAFAVLLGLDGSAVWRVVRVLVVIAVTALAVWFTRRAGRDRAGGGHRAGHRRHPAWLGRCRAGPGDTGLVAAAGRPGGHSDPLVRGVPR